MNSVVKLKTPPHSKSRQQRKRAGRGFFAVVTLAVAAAVASLLPAAALAEGTHEVAPFTSKAAFDTLWVLFAALLVMFMQAGFALLEIGFSRGKNAGSIVAKILTNFSVSSVAFWAVGFAFAFGVNSSDLGGWIGTHGFFLRDFGTDAKDAFAIMGGSDAAIEAKWLFQFMFCGVALAIVWGTTLERIKFGVYLIYGVIFSALIYPIAAHWVYGGGWLQTEIGMQDFAGSTAVHALGGAGALAVLLLLGPRKGKYVDGKIRPIPGHNMPLFGLGVIILWLGWFGFNAGSTLNGVNERFAEIALVTHMSVVAGVLAAMVTSLITQKTIDIGMVGNGAIAGAVSITAASGYVEPWAAVLIGAVGGVIVVLSVALIDKKIDDPVGALSAHGVCGIWGTLAVGIFSHPDLSAINGVGVKDGGEFAGGLWYSGSFGQLGAQALGVVVVCAFVFVASFAIFYLIKATYGLRVTEAEEDAGLDIVAHGMYGYPEQFIPVSELSGSGMPGTPSHASTALMSAETGGSGGASA